VPGGASFIGSFDREYAVQDETIDFFASGHALVEGLLAHYEDDPKGRVAFLEVTLPGATGIGVIAIYKDGPLYEVVALDSAGRARPEWADAIQRPALRAARMKPEDVRAHDWSAAVRGLGTRAPYAVAGVAVIGA
jgi:hypothetical protein